jgi:hypothetical protein
LINFIGRASRATYRPARPSPGEDSLAVLPNDPAAAAEEILRRREEGGFSYIVVGANAADALAPVVAQLTGH